MLISSLQHVLTLKVAEKHVITTSPHLVPTEKHTQYSLEHNEINCILNT